jgi:hypothetical protein
LNLESVIQQTTQTSTGYPVYPMTAPQSYGANPFILYQIIDTQHLHFLSGKSAQVATSRVQFSCMSNKIADCESMAEQIRNLWHGFSGEVDGVVIMAVWSNDERDTQEWREDGSDVVVFSADFDLFFKVRG